MKMLFLFLMCCPLGLLAQDKEVKDADLTGAWVGHLYNDTTREYIPYEIAISLEKDKLFGYSYITFMIDSVPNIGVKAQTVSHHGDEITVEDRKMIDDNYDGPKVKGVRTTLHLKYTENDTAYVLSGSWSTNATRKFNPLTGKVFLTRKKDVTQTKIVSKLVDLHLGNKLSFVSPEMLSSLMGRNYVHTQSLAQNETHKKAPEEASKKDSMMTIVEEPLVIIIPKDSTRGKKINFAGLDVTADTIGEVSAKVKMDDETVSVTEAGKKVAVPKPKKIQELKPDKSAVTGDSKVIAPGSTEPGDSKEIASKITPEVLKPEQPVAPSGDITNVKKVKSGNPVRKEPVGQQKILSNKKAEIGAPVVQASRQEHPGKERTLKFVNPTVRAAQNLSKREVETIRTVAIEQDSLLFTLYDNGVVDGDTVSVLLNGEVIMPRVGLSVVPHRMTVHITPEMGDSIKVIMYAENLGSLPPNTGLLIIQDGKKRYDIRFSGDLRKNSAIILTRKERP